MAKDNVRSWTNGLKAFPDAQPHLYYQCKDCGRVHHNSSIRSVGSCPSKDTAGNLCGSTEFEKTDGTEFTYEAPKPVEVSEDFKAKAAELMNLAVKEELDKNEVSRYLKDNWPTNRKKVDPQKVVQGMEVGAVLAALTPAQMQQAFDMFGLPAAQRQKALAVLKK